ncbi:Protein transport protein Sec61 subunit gamma [Phytophthora pseudosyringae]|uniref:Protein transport protein Sec61 subunit gamma n=1 Tax=Phytophthora pseudosyringae TaxID=221518 RepID=A0A8T1WHB7_9STRA|nr:Protein transport protein Sec61 subunit gamma [Phytophthora pseudosyringae]
MELLAKATPEQEARAAKLESERLCLVNGNPLNPRAFAADQKLRPRGAHSFLGAADRAFLSRSSRDGCLPAAQTSGGLLPLQRAVALGDLHSLELALASGGDSNALTRACNAFGETLLHTAVLHQQLGAVQLLLRHGASPLAKLPENPNRPAAESTLESTAPRTANFRYSRMLDAAEATPSHYACAAGHLEILKLLLSAVSNDAPKRWRPGSLLLWAITSAQPSVVEFLVLHSRLEADCFDEDGNNSVAIAALVLATPETPERLATLKTMLQLLLRRDPENGGADVNHKNMYGLTAFDVAETPASKQVLAQRGAMTARVVPVERVLRWDRDRFRDEIEYLPPLGRRRVILRTNEEDKSK